jgi:hypothetical protein
MSPEPERSEIPYWQLDELIGEVEFYHERWSLRVKAHLADQPYGRSAAAGLLPLSATHGTCTAVDAKAYILVPDITLDVALSPAERPTAALGTVTASEWHGMKAEYVGEASAFFYREDRLLCLWECFLEDEYQTGEASDDANYAMLWRGIEDLLQRRFPDAQQLVTTADDPLYEPADYQRFLTQLGYQRLNDRTFGKSPAPLR